MRAPPSPTASGLIYVGRRLPLLANLIFSEMINNNGVVIESTTGNPDVSIPFCPLPSSKVSFLLKRESLGALMMFGYLGSISAQNQELDD